MSEKFDIHNSIIPPDYPMTLAESIHRNMAGIAQSQDREIAILRKQLDIAVEALKKYKEYDDIGEWAKDAIAEIEKVGGKE